MSTSASMDLNKENLSSHAIPKDQLKTTKTEVKPIEIDGELQHKALTIKLAYCCPIDVIALAENKELDLMNTYVNLEKWIPMWQAVQLNGNQALFYPEDINLKKRKEYLFNGQVAISIFKHWPFS